MGARKHPAPDTDRTSCHLETAGGPPEPLTPEEIRAGVHLRLVQLDSERASWFTYSRELGGGFHELLVHTDGDVGRWLNDAEIANVDLAEVRELGRKRLLEIRPDECQIITGRGAEAYCVHGESSFIASKLLVLPDLLRMVGGKRMRWPDGVLVAVPSRHRIAFAPVDDAIADNLAAIATLAAYDHDHDHAPISPVVHWWKDDRLYPVFDPTVPGVDLHPDVPDEFWAAWERNVPGCEGVA
jgi:hypothetical protein